MQVPGPRKFSLQQVESKIRSTFSVLLVLALFHATAMSAAETEALPEPSPVPIFTPLGDVSARMPTALLNQFPNYMVKPTVLGPKKRIDPKYDVTMIGRRDVGKGMDFYSLQKEIVLGRQLSHEVENSVKLVQDPVITEYVNRIGQQLVRNSDAKVPFTIKVVDDNEVNAFALPGGFFYVNTGLIMACNNEAQLAGVMAHEIAHVAARHATKNQSRSELFDLISIPLIFFGGPAALIARQALSVAVPMGFLKFSRDAEREADMLGLQYDYATGYDPQEFVSLFEKMKKEEKHKKNFLAKAFSTHPMTGDRIKRAQKEIEKYLPPRDQYIVDTSEFEQVKTRVAELENRQRIDDGKVNLPILLRRGGDVNPDPHHGRPTLQRP